MSQDETNVRSAREILAHMDDILNLEITEAEVGWELCMWDDDTVGRVTLTSTDGMMFFSQRVLGKAIKFQKVRSPLTYESLNEAMHTMSFGMKGMRMKTI